MLIDQRIKHLQAAMDAFTKAELEAEFKLRTIELLGLHSKVVEEAEGIDFSDYSDLMKKKTLRKDDLIRLIILPFITKELYHTWLGLLEPNARKVWDVLVFEKNLHESTIEQRWGISVNLKKERYWYGNLMDRLTTGFKLFQTKRAGSWNNPSLVIGLPYGLRVLLKDHYDQPEEAKLVLLEDCPTTAFKYENGDQTILKELSRLYLYQDQGQIPITGKDRPKITSLGKMKKTLNLREFFEVDEKDKKLKILRTNALASLIVYASKNKKEETWLGFLKNTLLGQSLLNKCDTPAVLLSDIKGMGHVDRHYLAGIEPYYYTFFKEFPSGSWIDFDQVYHAARFNLLPMEPIQSWVAGDKLYYTYDETLKLGQHSYQENRHWIDESRYHEAIGIPYLKASVFMYAAIGAFDIAYDRPDRTIVGKTCHSAYDGLRYLRMTPLGAYLFGKTDTYKVDEELENTSVTFSPDALTITVGGDDTSMAFTLKPYTRQLGPNRYATENKTFLQGIHSKSELEKKIKMFREVTGTKFPENWEAFFTDLRQKVDPFVAMEEQMVLYKLPEDNRPLIQLIAQDPILKKIVLKAEGYHILFPKSKGAAFKKRLSEFGYLVT